ncbi:MAG: hypothetical protein R3A52_08905 [Polyangiales bacterium]
MFDDAKTAATLVNLVEALGFAAVELAFLDKNPDLRKALDEAQFRGDVVTESVWANTQAPTGWSQRLRLRVFAKRGEVRSSKLPASMEAELIALLRSGVPVVLERPTVDEFPAYILHDFDLGPSGADVISRQVLRHESMLLMRLQEVRTSPSSSPVSVTPVTPSTSGESHAPSEAPPWSGAALASAP